MKTKTRHVAAVQAIRPGLWFATIAYVYAPNVRGYETFAVFGSKRPRKGMSFEALRRNCVEICTMDTLYWDVLGKDERLEIKATSAKRGQWSLYRYIQNAST